MDLAQIRKVWPASSKMPVPDVRTRMGITGDPVSFDHGDFIAQRLAEVVTATTRAHNASL